MQVHNIFESRKGIWATEVVNPGITLSKNIWQSQTKAKDNIARYYFNSQYIYLINRIGYQVMSYQGTSGGAFKSFVANQIFAF